VHESHEPLLPDPSAKSLLIGEPTDTTGFLDARHLESDALGPAIREAFAILAAESVLTVYNSAAGNLEAIEDLCQSEGLDLASVIRHRDGGTTFTLREHPGGRDSSSPD
jgi:hypothetical protein